MHDYLFQEQIFIAIGTIIDRGDVLHNLYKFDLCCMATSMTQLLGLAAGGMK